MGRSVKLSAGALSAAVHPWTVREAQTCSAPPLSSPVLQEPTGHVLGASGKGPGLARARGRRYSPRNGAEDPQRGGTMEAEIREIRDHISRHAPFDGLTDDLLDEVAGAVEIAYSKAGTTIAERDRPVQALFYIRSGAVEVYRHNGQLSNRLGEGDIFGQFALLRDRQVRFPVQAIEDTLVYLIPKSVFDRLCAADDDFADFVELSGSRLQSTVEQSLRDNDMIATPVRRLISRLPVMIEESATVQEAARLMTENDVSSVLLLKPGNDEDSDRMFADAEGRQWLLTGMITDKDLRQRIVAEGASAQTPLSSISHGWLITIQSNESVNEAMLTMLRNNIQRLPVLHRRRPVGVVYLSDIVRYETNNSVYLVNNIFSRTSVKGLARLTPEVRASFVRLVDEGATSRMIGGAMSSVGRSLMRRLVELAEADLGPPPSPTASWCMAPSRATISPSPRIRTMPWCSTTPSIRSATTTTSGSWRDASATGWTPVATLTARGASWPPTTRGASPSPAGSATSATGSPSRIRSGCCTAPSSSTWTRSTARRVSWRNCRT